MEAKFAALRRGMLEPVTLAVLDTHSRYAGEIVEILRDSDFPLQDGTVYPLLNRMRREGLLVHEWRESPAGPPRKYFALSEEGRSQLNRFREYFRSLSALLDSIGES